MTGPSFMERKRILIVPLNWGLGHATRLIPVIKECVQAEAEVLIGGSPRHQSLLQQELGILKTISIPYLNIRLSKGNSQVATIALQLPRILLYIIREHNTLKRIIKTHAIDCVISDSCFGLWSSQAYCIFITHQLNIEIPDTIKFLQRLVNYFNHWLIRKFDECWVPDFNGNDSIAGKLSYPPIRSLRTTYLGPLSRFQTEKTAVRNYTRTKKKKLLILISGPEMQRTNFEEIIRSQVASLSPDIEHLVIRGLPDSEAKQPLSWYNHVSAGQLEILIREADYIICRAGYSTIMDLLYLQRTAILVPTPGHSEQEYLADYLSLKGYFLTMRQCDVDIAKAIFYLDNFLQMLLNNSIHDRSILHQTVFGLLRNGSAMQKITVNNPIR
jgi:UDP-N-acetylglucosamine:LPS N-acetylglucosamine transferase